MKSIGKLAFIFLLLSMFVSALFVTGCGDGGNAILNGGSNINGHKSVVEISGTLPSELLSFSAAGSPGYFVETPDGKYIVMAVDKSEKEIGDVALESSGTYRVTLPVSSYDTYIMLLVKDKKSGLTLFRNILGRLPVFNSQEAPSAEIIDKINIVGVSINEITTARALLAMEKGIVDGAALPFFSIDTSEIQSDKTVTKRFTDGKTPFDESVERRAGGEDNIRELANAVNTVVTILASGVDGSIKSQIMDHTVTMASEMLEAFNRALNETGAVQIIKSGNLSTEINIKTGTDTSECNIVSVTINQSNSTTEVFAKDITNIKPIEQIAAPEFSVACGAYASSFEVIISCKTIGASIKYTLDGSSPSPSNGLTYSLPVLIDKSVMLKAIAFKSNMYNSPVNCVSYYIDAPDSQIAVPCFGLAEGTYSSAKLLQISCETYGAIIKYTINGADPSAAAGIAYSCPFMIDSSSVVKAVAIKRGKTSAVASALYVIKPDALIIPKPEFTLISTNGTKKIKISCSDAEAKIVYTLDGSDPDKLNGIAYSTPVLIDRTTTIKAMAFKEESANSEIAKETFLVSAALDIAIEFSGVLCASYNALKHSVMVTNKDVVTAIKPAVAFPAFTAATKIEPFEKYPFIKIKDNDTGFEIMKLFTGKVPEVKDMSAGVSAVKLINFKIDHLSTARAIIAEEKSLLNVACITPAAEIAFNGVITKDMSEAEGCLNKLIEENFGGAKNIAELAKAIEALDAVISSNEVSRLVKLNILGDKKSYSSAGDVVLMFIKAINEPSALEVIAGKGLAVSIEIGGRAINAQTKLNDVNSIINKFKPKAASPYFSVASGEYSSTREVMITTVTSGAKIKYTLDGSEPTNINGIEYISPILVGNSVTIKALAIKDGFDASDVITADYKISPSAAVLAPRFYPAHGVYNDTMQVAITSASEGALIYYTLDGTQPSRASIFYNGPFEVSKSLEIKAIAVKNSTFDSNITVAEYKLKASVKSITLNHAPGTYDKTVEVAFGGLPYSAKIIYTLDGSLPTATNGFEYTKEIVITKDVKLTYILTRPGFENSDAVAAEFKIMPSLPSPAIEPLSGVFDSSAEVKITSAVSGASVKYTLDGSVPSASNGFDYTAPVFIAKNTLVKAVATKAGHSDSPVASSDLKIRYDASGVKASKTSGAYYETIEVGFNVPAGGALVYTLDGTEPAPGKGVTYGGTIEIFSVATLKYIVTMAGFEPSKAVTLTYDVKPELKAAETPVFSVLGGAYEETKEVAITTATSGAVIRYTLDGSDPASASGLIYSGTFAVALTSTIKAIAVKDGFKPSIQASAEYIIKFKAAAPQFNLKAGIYVGARYVTITTDTFGADIYYTLDGTEPSETNGKKYTAPVAIAIPSTLKAIALKQDMAPSDVTSALYNIYYPLPVVNTPVFSPAAGGYIAPYDVTVTTATAGASIYYTTDGSTPTRSSTLYAGAINITALVTIKAIAVKNGYQDSQIASGVFSISLSTNREIASNTMGVGQKIKVTTDTAGAVIHIVPAATAVNYTAVNAVSSLNNNSGQQATVSADGTAYSANILIPLTFTGGSYKIYASVESTLKPSSKELTIKTGSDAADAIPVYYLEDLDATRNSLATEKYYKLARDLDFNSDGSYSDTSNKTTWTTGSGWAPIGNSSATNHINFDGNNRKISNLKINRNDTDYVGLFCYFDNFTVKNLTIDSPDVYGKGFVGALVGRTYNPAIDNVDVTGGANAIIKSNGGYIGGILGWVLVNGTISNCDFNGKVMTSLSNCSYMGGIVGQIKGGSISNCTVTGDINTDSTGSQMYIGGIAGGSSGDNADVTISGCTNNSSIKGYKLVGGISGACFKGNNTVTVTNCTSLASSNLSETKSGNCFGGIVGQNNNGGSESNCIIKDCTSSATISAGTSYGVGGIVGRNFGYIYDCTVTALSDISGDHMVGGISGSNEINSLIDGDSTNTGSRKSAQGKLSAKDSIGNGGGGISGMNDRALIKNYESRYSLITRTSGTSTSFGRICGVNTVGGTLSNNYANANMTYSVSGDTNFPANAKTAAGIDGANLVNILATSALSDIGTAGIVEVSDRIILNFSAAMDTSVLGTGANFNVVISNANPSVITIYKGAVSTAAADKIVEITTNGQQYNTHATMSFKYSSGAWSGGNTTLTLTLALPSGGMVNSAQTANTFTVTYGAAFPADTATSVTTSGASGF